MPADGDSSPPKQRGAKLPKGVHKMNDPIVNPCVPEQDASQKCMNDSNYDRSACGDYFDNYRNCMKFWSKLARERKWKGIKPHMPPPEERVQILKDMDIPNTES